MFSRNQEKKYRVRPWLLKKKKNERKKRERNRTQSPSKQ